MLVAGQAAAAPDRPLGLRRAICALEPLERGQRERELPHEKALTDERIAVIPKDDATYDRKVIDAIEEYAMSFFMSSCASATSEV